MEIVAHKLPYLINDTLMKKLIIILFFTVGVIACNQSETQQQQILKVIEGIEENPVTPKMDILNEKKQDSFAYLETLKIANDWITVHYDKTSATIINKNLADLQEGHLLRVTDGPAMENILVLEFTMSSQPKDKYALVFSAGPSADPAFLVYDAKNWEIKGTFPGTDIYIPGTNSVYVTGKENNCFNKKSKYVFTQNMFIEAIQPFYYVGLQTKTLKPMVLYSDQNLTHQLASLPGNYAIEVVMAENGNAYNPVLKYLIKTSFGLVGWAEINGFNNGNGYQVEGIKYMGD